MSKKLCKGIRKDGSPCKGKALDQYDGYCIAHGPTPDQAFEWRSQGGKNSATAARLDKRIPERLKGMLDILDDGMKQVIDGTLSPARYTAVCRGVKMKLDVYRLADQDMELIRAEEIQAAAAAYLDTHANLDVLEAADDIAAGLEQYRAEALVDQGFAEIKEPFKPDQPSEIFLNDKGRRRFGYRNLNSTQQLLNEIEDQLTDYSPYLSNLSEITDLLQTLQADVENTLSNLARDDVAPFDPLTGRSITELPSCVQTRSKLDRLIHDEIKPQERLQEQLSMIKQLMHKAEELAQDEDDKQELVEAETNGQEPEEAETNGQVPEEAETNGQELEEAETYGSEPEVAATYGPELKSAATFGQEPQEAETYSQELELAPTYEPEPEEAETYGHELEVAAPYGPEPEKAEQGSKKLEYIKESLKASGAPIESVPAHFRWK